MTLIRTYKYKLKPTKGQVERLQWTLDRCRELYNAALEERIRAYKKAKASLNYVKQTYALKEIKQVRPEYKEVNAQVLENVLRRLDNAYKAFFRRVKNGEKAGFPRFKGKHRYDSFTYRQYGKLKKIFKKSPKHIYLPAIGDVKIHLHRAIEGKIKTCTIKRDSCGDWWATLSCEVQAQSLPKTGQVVGIDVGVSNIIATSDGELVQAPRHLRKAEKALRKAQRRLSRRKKGSERRKKARLAVAKIHRKTQRQRLDFLHKLTTNLVKKYDLIALEALTLQGLNKGILAKSFNDVALGHFNHLLDYKAADAGKTVVRVDPRYTSQDCSCCGHRSGKKPLHVRSWTCEKCQAKHDRDINAAKNILAKASPSSANGSRLLQAVA